MREYGVLVLEGGLQALVLDQAAVSLVYTRCRCAVHHDPVSGFFFFWSGPGHGNCCPGTVLRVGSGIV